MRRIAAVLIPSIVSSIVLVTASSAFAESADPAPTAALHDSTSVPVGTLNNALSVQLGIFMPGLAAVTVDYTRVVSPHFEVSADLGLGGLLADSICSGTIIPRLRAQAGPVTFAVGAGAGVVVVSGGDSPGAHGYLAADVVISYETEDHVVFQLRSGVTGGFDHAGTDAMSLRFSVWPFGGLGAGFKF